MSWPPLSPTSPPSSANCSSPMRSKGALFASSPPRLACAATPCWAESATRCCACVRVSAPLTSTSPASEEPFNAKKEFGQGHCRIRGVRARFRHCFWVGRAPTVERLDAGALRVAARRLLAGTWSADAELVALWRLARHAKAPPLLGRRTVWTLGRADGRGA